MAAPAWNFRGVALLAVLPPEHRSAARARRGALGGVADRGRVPLAVFMEQDDPINGLIAVLEQLKAEAAHLMAGLYFAQRISFQS